MKRPTRRRRSQHEVEEILAAYRRSGLSQPAFCEDRGLALSTLAYWLSKDRRSRKRSASKTRSVPSQLVPVRIVEDPRPESASSLEVESAHGFVLRVPVGIEPELLARYLHALESRC